MNQVAQARTVLTLYTTADGIQCHRVRLILAAKGVNYEREIVDSSRPPEDLVEINPYGDVPTLTEHDMTLYDTTVVSEYLDERYPHPPLMPIDPLSRARLRLATARIEYDWLPLIDTIGKGGRSASTARKHLREQLLTAVPLFKASPYFLNLDMSLADCLVAPVVWRLPMLGIKLGRAGKPIMDYGERIFHTRIFVRSLTKTEKAMRE